MECLVLVVEEADKKVAALFNLLVTCVLFFSDHQPLYACNCSTYPHMKLVKAINPKHFYSPTQTFKAQRHCRRGAEWWFPGCCSLATAPKPLCWPTKVESKAQLACPSAPLLMAIMLTWGQNSFLYIKKTPSPYMPLSYLISFYKNLCSKMNAADVYSSEKRLCFEATQ